MKLLVACLILSPVLMITTLSEQSGTALSARQTRFILIDEGQKYVASNTLGICSPISPAVRRLYSRTKLLSPKLGLFLALQFKIIKKFEKHDPCKQGQAVEVAIEPLVFAHNIACRFNQASQCLAGRQRRFAAVSLFFLVFSLGAIEYALQVVHSGTELFGTPEQADDFTRITVIRDRWNV